MHNQFLRMVLMLIEEEHLFGQCHPEADKHVRVAILFGPRDTRQASRETQLTVGSLTIPRRIATKTNCDPRLKQERGLSVPVQHRERESQHTVQARLIIHWPAVCSGALLFGTQLHGPRTHCYRRTKWRRTWRAGQIFAQLSSAESCVSQRLACRRRRTLPSEGRPAAGHG